MPSIDTRKSVDRAARSGLSLRLRLMLMLLAVFGVLQVGISAVHLLYVRQTASTLFNDRLGEQSEVLASRLAPLAPHYTDEVVARIAEQEGRKLYFGRLRVTLFDTQGNLVATNDRVASESDKTLIHSAVSSDPLQMRPRPAAVDGGPAQRSMVRNFSGPDASQYVIAVTAAETLVRSLSDDFSTHIVMFAPIGLLVAAVAGWLIAGVAVKPILRLGQIARGLRPETIQDPIKLGSSASELTKLQRELDDMRRRLETGYEAQQRFVANVSHEIKTPIATVLTEAQTLPKSLVVSPEIRQFVDSTQDEMRRLGRLVESFLLLTRVRHGKPLESTARAIGVNDVVMDSMQNCWRMAEQYGVTLVPELAPEEDRDFDVLGDPELLRTMLDNLIRNGIRFSPHNQPVRILVRPNVSDVSLCVRDTGPGIPPELIGKIFDRFSQAKSEEKLGRGSGLGLEIAQGIAELHGGKISVSNRDEGGCEFCATLPLMTRQPAPRRPSSAALVPAT